MRSQTPGPRVTEAASRATAPTTTEPSSDARYAAIVESSDDAILSKDAEGLITSWNPAAERMYGYTAPEAIGRPISILIPKHRAGEERTILDRVFGGQRVMPYETERVTKDGDMIVVSLTVSPVRDESGDVVSASVIARDVTARRRSAELASGLHAVTAALSKEITPERAIDVLLEQAPAALGADAGAVGLLDPSRQEIELAGTAGYTEEGLAGWGRFPLDSELPMSVAIRLGEPIWTTSPEELQTRFPLLAGASIRFDSLAVIPLAVEGVPFGALSLSFAARRSFDPEERVFLVAAAQQAAYALERARLHEAERLANERLTFLAEAGEVLAGSLNPDDTMGRIAELAVGRVADWCGIELLDADGGLRSVAVAHVDPARVRLARELRSRYPTDPDAEQGVPHVIRTNAAELYSEVTDQMLVEAAHDDEHLRLMRELGLASAMIVPLRARGKVLGAITFVASESGRRFDERDLSLAEDLSRRAALAIDNSMLFRREHEAAVTLQRSLLPEILPQMKGARFAARYEPAAPGLEVGGDWYEVIALDDGTVGVTIGDIAGRGIRAASVMGRVRPALRAYVMDGHGPVDSLKRLDRLMKEAEREEMTTVFHLQFDPVAGTAEYVRAGHPPALLRLPDGEVRELAGSGTPPLGVLEEVEYHSHPAELPGGSLLLLYTDGLIERRDADLDAGIARLKEVLVGAPSVAEECLEHLSSEFRADEIPDDVAMLAMSVGEVPA